MFSLTKAPKSRMLTTSPSIISPGSNSCTISLIIASASLNFSISWPVITTKPSSSILISHSVTSIILLIIFPPGPITIPIFSGLMCKLSNLGA